MIDEPIERRLVPAPAGSVPSPDFSSGSEMSIADIVNILVRSKWLILAFVAVGLAASVAYVKLKTPLYEATVDVQIDPSRVGSLGLSELLSLAGGGGDSNEVATQLLILRSQTVIFSAINSLAPAQQHQLLGLSKLPDFARPESMTPNEREGIIGSIEARLNLKNVEGTQVVAVSFRDKHPQLAADFANSLVSAYIANNFNSRYNSVQQVSDWLSGQMKSLQAQADQAQRDLSDFQQKNNIAGPDITNNTTMDRLKALNAELTQAQADRIAAEAKYRIAQSGNPDVLTTLAPDPGLQTLQSQKAQLLIESGQLSSKFGPKYPPLTELGSQQRALNAEISSEVSHVTGRLKEDYDTSVRNESLLNSEYQKQTAAAFALNRQVAEYVILRDKEQSSRDLYDMLEYKLQQAGIDAGLGSVNTSIVDRATAPATPVEPKVFLTIALGCCIGIVSGVGAAFLSEATNDTLRDLAGVESISRLPVLGAIPEFDRKDLTTPSAGSLPLDADTGANLSMVTIHRPQSRSSEAFRGLRNAILLSSLDRGVKTVLITSSLPKEGKSTVAANYAVSLAQRGARVLLVDMDLRRPRQHSLFHSSNRIGLSTWLAGGDPVILHPISSLPNLHFVPAGPKVASPAEVLGSDRVRELIRELEGQYDHIILDSAPILSVSDSVPLATWADGVLVIARFNVTPGKALSHSVGTLRRANARIRGVILNGVTSHADGYYYYGKYAGAYYEQA